MFKTETKKINMIVSMKEKWFCFDGYTLGGVGV